MKTIIFSDTHLEKKFDKETFVFLKKIISNADKVIISGDFFEGLLFSFEEFLNSEWKPLFELLKTKETIYVVGNHDEEVRDKNLTISFAKTYKQRYIFNQGGKRYIVHHGHQYDLSFHKGFGFVDLNKLGHTFKIWLHFYIVSEKILTRAFGKLLLQNAYKKFNRELKSFIQKEAKENDIFIFGHTHAAEIDLENKFINTGFIRHGLGQYVEITDKPYLREIWYKKPFWKF